MGLPPSGCAPERSACVNSCDLRVLRGPVDACDHSGFHTGQGRYTADTAQLHYVMVCEGCGCELRLIESVVRSIALVIR